MKRMLTLAGLAALALPALAQHQQHGQVGSQAGPWTDEPLIQVIPDRKDRSQAQLRLANLQAAQITVFPPQGEARQLDLEAGAAQLGTGPVGNYHWLQAREETPELVKVASAVRYFGNPGPAPTALLAQAKSELEIVPQPLPREHWQYRSKQSWQFQLRFQGQALANATLHFMSRNGSHAASRSGPDGMVDIAFPDDWPASAKTGQEGHSRPSTPFVLMVEHEAAGRRFHTTFNASYGPDPMAERNLAAGAGFLALGGVLALPLLRRRKSGSKEASA